MKSHLVSAASACALAVLSMHAQASVLTFTSPNGDFANNQTIALPTLSDPTLPIYGDHINAATFGTVTSPNAYSYGTTYGLTPHIGVSYGPGSASAATSSTNPYPVYYPGNFGNLTGVLYQVDFAIGSGTPSVYVPNLTLSVTLTADPGYAVSLRSFDLAAWNTFPSNLDLLDIIVDGTHNVIGTNLTVANTPTTRTSVDFTTSPYTGSTIQILLDGRDTSHYGGDPFQAFLNFTDLSIDNIAFEEVPEPTTAALLATATLLLPLRRPKK